MFYITAGYVEYVCLFRLGNGALMIPLKLMRESDGRGFGFCNVAGGIYRRML